MGRGGADLAQRQGAPLKLAPQECLPAGTAIENPCVFLACTHLDHEPSNKDLRNLKTLCQSCHILHDRAEHLRQCWFTYRRRKALEDLFLGPYLEDDHEMSVQNVKRKKR